MRLQHRCFPMNLPCSFIKKRLQHRCFPMNLAKFLRTAFFIEHIRELLFKVTFETSQNFTMKNKKLLLSCPGVFINNLDHVYNWVGCFYWWQWSSKSSLERLCECETSVTSLCTCCDNVTTDTKHKVYIVNGRRINYKCIIATNSFVCAIQYGRKLSYFTLIWSLIQCKLMAKVTV